VVLRRASTASSSGQLCRSCSTQGAVCMLMLVTQAQCSCRHCLLCRSRQLVEDMPLVVGCNKFLLLKETPLGFDCEDRTRVGLDHDGYTQHPFSST
jgi:hypothetical protein